MSTQLLNFLNNQNEFNKSIVEITTNLIIRYEEIMRIKDPVIRENALAGLAEVLEKIKTESEFDPKEKPGLWNNLVKFFNSLVEKMSQGLQYAILAIFTLLTIFVLMLVLTNDKFYKFVKHISNMFYESIKVIRNSMYGMIRGALQLSITEMVNGVKVVMEKYSLAIQTILKEMERDGIPRGSITIAGALVATSLGLAIYYAKTLKGEATAKS